MTETCIKCQHANAIFSVFSIDPGSNRLHIETTTRMRAILNYCKECARELVKSDESVIGYLNKVQAKEYIKACTDDSPCSLFHKDGIVVLDLDTTHETHFYTSKIIDACKKKMSLLSNTVDNKATHKTDDSRVWSNIFPGNMDPENKNYQKLLKDIRVIVPSLEKKLLPHEFYGLAARNRYRIDSQDFDDEVSLKPCADSSPSLPVVKNTEILGIKKLNVFARGENLQTPQTWHIDSDTMTIEVIHVQKCGDNGYDFRCFKGSHRRMTDIPFDIPVDPKKSTMITAKQGQYICFADSLIHCGGIASRQSHHPSDDIFKNAFGGGIRGTIPTDVSFQLTLSHMGTRESLYTGKGQVFSFKKEATMCEEQVKFRKYIENAKDEFGDALLSARIHFFQSLMGKRIPQPKKKRRTTRSIL